MNLNPLKMSAGILAALLCASCAPGGHAGGPGSPTSDEPAVAPSLSGTSWQLLQIMSMDDQVFTPDEPARYTLQFRPDGRLLLRADCNRGQGRWTLTEPSGIVLEALATTRAMCPPGSLHDRFLSDLGYVRSFVLKDGRLYLATMADGAILEFESLAP